MNYNCITCLDNLMGAVGILNTYAGANSLFESMLTKCFVSL